LVGRGIDPVDARKRHAPEAATLGFDKYVTTFSDGYLKTEWGSSWPQAKRQLEMHVVPVLADKPMPVIETPDIAVVLDRLRDRPALQKNVYAWLRRMFRWAMRFPCFPMDLAIQKLFFEERDAQHA
jgi:hypothetical protein